MKPNKRLWELHPSTICKVLGTALPLEDLQRIARTFGIYRNDYLPDGGFVLHTALVRLCKGDNPVARYTEKLIEQRFLVYGKEIPLDDPARIVQSVRESPQHLRVPLWAILWGLATRDSLRDGNAETALLELIHIMEHRLLEDYWKYLSWRDGEDCRYTGNEPRIPSLQRDLFDMQWANGILAKIIASWRSRLTSSSPLQGSPTEDSDLTLSTAATCQCANRKVHDLRVLLARAKYCNWELEDENAQLKEEIEGLLEELNRHEPAFGDRQPDVFRRFCPDSHNLGGKKVTLVGGIESLECHYRQLIESAGGRFGRHDGVSDDDGQELEECIAGSDLVVCPVAATGHSSAKWVKRICKACGVRCCFPKSASLTALRRALQEHYSDERAA